MMFGIFGNDSRLHIKTSDEKTVKAIEDLKETARTEMRKYDDLVNKPDNTAEQRRFLETGRECFKSVVETGYSH